MAPQLIVKDQMEINASKASVWEVLIDPEFIRQWDDIPENYTGGHLQAGSTINWEGYSKMTVVHFSPEEQLSLKLFLPQVKLDPEDYNVRYSYTLSEKNGQTLLRFEIGDFSSLPNGKDYYDASLEWVETAKSKIKSLAEKR